MTVRAIPEGYHTVTPYLVVEGVPKLIEFLTRAFDAKEVFRMAMSDGTIRHAEVQIGDSRVMMGEAQGPHRPIPAMLHLYVADADAVYARALRAGATSITAPADQFYGDRTGGVQDACGNQWWIATHNEDVSAEELARRAEAAQR
ncbi:MAG: VOC family protein [Deltaproteobacteria bacterium]|nr:MAG: VOC family protein [Deltaproteobacteria bacterium]